MSPLVSNCNDKFCDENVTTSWMIRYRNTYLVVGSNRHYWICVIFKTVADILGNLDENTSMCWPISIAIVQRSACIILNRCCNLRPEAQARWSYDWTWWHFIHNAFCQDKSLKIMKFSEYVDSPNHILIAVSTNRQQSFEDLPATIKWQ